MRPTRSALPRFVRAAALALALAPLAAAAQPTAARALAAPPAADGAPSLHPPEARVTDEAIVADRQAYEAMQAKLEAINARGRPLSDGTLAAAQCWLDASLTEYERNDRSGFPAAALGEAARLAAAMERGEAGAPVADGAAGGSGAIHEGRARLRPDLHARLDALAPRTAACPAVAAPAACGRVRLAHASHERAQIGWRHAAPYVAMAEDLVARAEAAAERCGR